MRFRRDTVLQTRNPPGGDIEELAHTEFHQHGADERPKNIPHSEAFKHITHGCGNAEPAPPPCGCSPT